MFFRRSNKQEPLSDPELIALYKSSRDSNHVAILFERYSLQIFGICRKYMKDEEQGKDTAMQVFEYLLDELLKYEINNFKSWLARATKNFCLMQLRKAKSQLKKSEEYQKNEQGLMEATDFLHLNGVNDKEKKLVALEDALEGLSKEQRVCVELFYLKEKTYEQVAQETGYSLKQVKSYIQNGKRNLKVRLSKENE